MMQWGVIVHCALICLHATRTGVAAQNLGTWSSVIDLPLVPVAAANLPDGNILLWASADIDGYFGVGTVKATSTAIFNVQDQTATLQVVTNTEHNMFCPGTSMLFDGSIFVNGGSNSEKTSIYEPSTGNWRTGYQMTTPRGYNGNTVLTDGKVFTIGGSWSGFDSSPRNGEVYSSNGWEAKPGISVNDILTQDRLGVYRSDNHPWLYPIFPGKVFHAGPSTRMNIFDTNGIGSTQWTGERGDSADAMNGNCVMWSPGRLITMGGSPDYDDSPATARAFAISFSMASQPVVEEVSPMNYARAFHNSVVLPNGQVIVIGGVPFAKVFSDTDAVLAAEVYSPMNKTFQILAPMVTPRTYHSVALLMLDGRVFVGGGGLCTNLGCNVNHLNCEIFTPPYLYQADGITPAIRPVLFNAPSVGYLGSQILVSTDMPARFRMVRMSATTHSVNNDQRRVHLPIVASFGYTYLVNIPANPTIALPGNYMLFAMANGVPSIGKVISIQPMETFEIFK